MSETLQETIANYEAIKAKYAGKNLLNLGELKELVYAQDQVISALCETIA